MSARTQIPLMKARGALPLRGRRPAAATPRNAGSQERALWGRCWTPRPAPPLPKERGLGALAALHKDRRSGMGEWLNTDTPDGSTL